MSGGLSKLGSALIAVFSVCLLLLAAELLYVFCRRRRFQRRSAAASASASASAAGDSSSSLYVLSSKELLYFFCLKNQSARIGPNEANVISINGPDQVEEYHGRDHDHHAVEIDDVMKIHQQGMCGQSRLLFTIKEEEEADHDHDNRDRDRERSSSSDGLDRLDGCDGGDDDDQTEKTVMSSTVTDSSTDDDVAVAVLDEATPFSTPCGSPPYYTPSPSPSREELKVSVHDSYCVSASSEKVPFVCVEIIGV